MEGALPMWALYSPCAVGTFPGDIDDRLPTAPPIETQVIADNLSTRRTEPYEAFHGVINRHFPLAEVRPIAGPDRLTPTRLPRTLLWTVLSGQMSGGFRIGLDCHQKV
jgi:hypothetical protein